MITEKENTTKIVILFITLIYVWVKPTLNIYLFYYTKFNYFLLYSL